MAPSNRIRCFVEMAIMMLAVAAPSFGQISAHGYISDCDQNKVLSDYANDNMGSRWTRYLLGDSDLKSTPQSSARNACRGGSRF
jgi:hypothetical protein